MAGKHEAALEMASHDEHNGLLAGTNGAPRARMARLARAESYGDSQQAPPRFTSPVATQYSSQSPLHRSIDLKQPYKDSSTTTKAMSSKYDSLEASEKPGKLGAGSGLICSVLLCRCCGCCRPWLLGVLLVVLTCVAAIYCLPFVEVDSQVARRLPDIAFHFGDGPLRPAEVSKFKFERLFDGQLYGPESLALDSAGNFYTAVEGGFVLYGMVSSQNNQTGQLVQIAELNPIRQVTAEERRARQQQQQQQGGVPASAYWRRECQLDEKCYGSELSSQLGGAQGNQFASRVKFSRCSKPLGVRLSKDEAYLYVVDTLSGLFRVNLRESDRQVPSQRSVRKLIDFREVRNKPLPVALLDVALTSSADVGPDIAIQMRAEPSPEGQRLTTRAYMNVSLVAVDDLTIDHGAGTNNGDLIYLSVGSQRWNAVSFIYDLLEFKPTGIILVYDTNSRQLSVLSPMQVAHVRQSSSSLPGANTIYDTELTQADAPNWAPRLDENDVFDDRPLHFPNGMQVMDDKQAILIADTANKRIIKHYIKGPRKGTSDLWAWTPNFPDNIRRGYDRDRETYWLVGCGHDPTGQLDMISMLSEWPRLRKYILKNVYLLGWLIESLGAYVLGSPKWQDFGYSLRIGHSLCESACSGMMVLQYNKHGQLLRSIYNPEFPKDLAYYSQVNEVIDSQRQQHFLYLSSPSYHYVTKLTLPYQDLFKSTTNPNDIITQPVTYRH